MDYIMLSSSVIKFIFLIHFRRIQLFDSNYCFPKCIHQNINESKSSICDIFYWYNQIILYMKICPFKFFISILGFFKQQYITFTSWQITEMGALIICQETEVKKNKHRPSSKVCWERVMSSVYYTKGTVIYRCWIAINQWKV